MLSSIGFSNFKCLGGKTFPLRLLNVFTGYNGRGKSSVMQAILMLSQSIKKGNNNSLASLHLNGEFVSLGDFDEVVADENSNLGFSLRISNGSVHEISLKYGLSDYDVKIGNLTSCVIDGDDYFDSAVGFIQNSGIIGAENKKTLTKQLPLYLNSLLGPQNVHFVSANRQGPVKFVEKHEIPMYHRVGADGRMTINTLATYQDMVRRCMNVDVHDNEEHTLLTSAAQWIDYIMSGGVVGVSGMDTKGRSRTVAKSSVLSLNFSSLSDDAKSFNSYNVGFGYSYVLSIVLTALIAKEGNIVIVENPEAHLHPEAQLRLTYMLATLASSGVQVFIETHSEHVVNGVRLAALKDEYRLGTSDISICFFDKDFSCKHLDVSPNGKIRDWPSRFFDQYQMELAEILKLGAKR